MNQKVTDIVSKVVTVLLHPLLMPIYSTLLVIYTPTPYSNMPLSLNVSVLGSVCFFACLVPLVVIGVFIAVGLVSDIEMPTRKERVWPMASSALVIGLALLFYLRGLPRPIVGMLMGEMLLLTLAACLSVFWKVSLHAMGIGGMLSFVSVVGMAYAQDFTWAAAVCFIAAAVTAWTRLYARAHTPAQLIAGYICGAVVMGIVMNFVMQRPVF